MARLAEGALDTKNLAVRILETNVSCQHGEKPNAAGLLTGQSFGLPQEINCYSLSIKNNADQFQTPTMNS